MTVTYVGVGVASGGTGSSRHPALPTGVVAGDLLLCFVAVRDSGTPVAPDGWSTALDMSNAAIFAKIAASGETAPTVTLLNTADSSFAQVAAWRGVSLSVIASAAQLNSSAQNIAYPALTTTRHGLVIYAGWRQDDWTSVAAISGATEIAEVTTSGGNSGIVWDYVESDAATIASGSFTVTGGTSAISRGGLVALDTAAITATTQDVYPPRVQLAVTGLTVGDAVELYRVVANQRTLVRAGSSDAVADTSFIRTDAELPFGVPVSYVAAINGTDGPAVDATTYTLPGGKVVLSDAITGLAAEVVITAWPDKPRARRSSTFVAGGRNVAVLGDLAGFSGTVDVYVETTSAVNNVAALLENATSGTIQIRQPGGYDGVDSYVAVLGVTEHRFSQDGSDERRTFSLDALQNDGWAPALEARAFTYGDVEDAYTDLTYADAEGDFDTYLDAILADWS